MKKLYVKSDKSYEKPSEYDEPKILVAIKRLKLKRNSSKGGLVRKNDAQHGRKVDSDKPMVCYFLYKIHQMYSVDANSN